MIAEMIVLSGYLHIGKSFWNICQNESGYYKVLLFITYIFLERTNFSL